MELQESFLPTNSGKHVSQRMVNSRGLGGGKGCLICSMFCMTAVSLLCLLMTIQFGMAIFQLEQILDQEFQTLDKTKINFMVSAVQNKAHFDGIVDAGGTNKSYKCSYIINGAFCKGTADEKEQAMISFQPSGPEYYLTPRPKEATFPTRNLDSG